MPKKQVTLDVFPTHAMIRGGRNALNKTTTVMATMKIAGIMPGIKEFCESRELSNSPPHSSV